MKATIKKPTTVNVKFLKVKAGVRYWEDSTVNDIEDTDGELTPCREGDLWCPLIDVDSGKILNWEQGKSADVHFKVCDCCGWDVLDENKEVIVSEDGDYVPDTLCPKDNGYGDYIIMSIDKDGMIDGWDFEINDFIKNEDDE